MSLKQKTHWTRDDLAGIGIDLDKCINKHLASEATIKARQPQVCGQCSKQFESKRADSKFCSNKCRQRAYNAKLRSAYELVKGQNKQPDDAAPHPLAQSDTEAT